MNNKILLTIIIPSYNRKKELLRLMDRLKEQTNQYFNIVVSDNHSSMYDVYDVLKDYTDFFKERLSIYKNNLNIGASPNICNSFMYINTKWAWLLGDDDIPSKCAIEKILEYLDDKLCAIHFSLYNLDDFMNSYKDIMNLHEFINFYNEMSYGKKKIKNCQGDLICMSEIVYNWDICKQYYEKQNFYSYTKVSQILPFLLSLNYKKGIYRIVNEKIIDVDEQNQHWKMGKIMLGMTTFSHIEFDLSKKERKDLNLLVVFKYPNVLRYFLNGQIKKEDILKIYDGIYKHSLPLKDRIIYNSILIIKPNSLIAKKIIKYKDNLNRR